jgi:nitronate monooxygenase
MSRWPTALTDLLGVPYPIVQAPMAGFSMHPLAIAVANAGGLGSLGTAVSTPDQCRAEIEAMRAATNRAFGVNFFVHAPPGDDPARTARMRARLAPYYAEVGREPPETPGTPPPPFGEAMLELVLAERPKVVSFHFGLPEASRLRAVKDTGAIVLASATTVAEARELEAAGVDAVIAQGYEAGGHQGSFKRPLEVAGTGTIALVPQIVDAVGCPVIAAGGLMDGRGIAAAFMLGAAGVQLGTAFLGCPEATVSTLHRQALRESNDESTRVTTVLSGRPARTLANRFVTEMVDAQTDALDFPLQRGMVAPLAQAAAERGSAEFSPLWAGQGAPLVRELPAAELMAALIAETETALTGR